MPVRGYTPTKGSMLDAWFNGEISLQKLVEVAVARDSATRQLTRLEECRATVAEHKAVQQSRLVTRLNSNLQVAISKIDEQR